MKLLSWHGDRVKGRVNQEVQNAIKRSIILMMNDAKRDCPVITGRLMGSISVNWSGSGLGRGEVDSPAKSDDGVGEPSKDPNTFVGVCGTNVEYGLSVEKTRKNPKPYLRPAFDRHKNWRQYLGKI